MGQRKHMRSFGFKQVSSQEKRVLVDHVFSDVAGKYDLMNDFMSLGVHRLWKDELCNMIPNMNSKILDVAGGTGDIAFRLKKKGRLQNKDTHIVVSDINEEMLKICQDRAIDLNILNNFDLVVADAEKLPFPDDSFDYYTIAFGIRNMVSIENALAEALRVLKPTGKILCLEFSQIQSDYLKPLYDFYSFNIIPKIGKCIADNEDAYRYLAESIRLFPNQEEFKTLIQKIGFLNVGYKNLSFGIASIHYGFKI